jgi:hypothetical protein
MDKSVQENQLRCLWAAANRTFDATGRRLTDGLKLDPTNAVALIQTLLVRCQSALPISPYSLAIPGELPPIPFGAAEEERDSTGGRPTRTDDPAAETAEAVKEMLTRSDRNNLRNHIDCELIAKGIVKLWELDHPDKVILTIEILAPFEEAGIIHAPVNDPLSLPWREMLANMLFGAFVQWCFPRTVAPRPYGRKDERMWPFGSLRHIDDAADQLPEGATAPAEPVHFHTCFQRLQNLRDRLENASDWRERRPVENEIREWASAVGIRGDLANDRSGGQVGGPIRPSSTDDVYGTDAHTLQRLEHLHLWCFVHSGASRMLHASRQMGNDTLQTVAKKQTRSDFDWEAYSKDLIEQIALEVLLAFLAYGLGNALRLAMQGIRRGNRLIRALSRLAGRTEATRNLGSRGPSAGLSRGPKPRGKRSGLSNRGTVRTGPGKGPKRRTGVPDGTERWSSKPGKETSAENARGHFEKHVVKKNEFPELKTEKQYIDAANDFVTNPPKTAEIFVRESGEVMIYDPPTNTFAVRTPEGPPATFMRPKNGAKYWETQLKIDGGKRQ